MMKRRLLRDLRRARNDIAAMFPLVMDRVPDAAPVMVKTIKGITVAIKILGHRHPRYWGFPEIRQ